MKRKKAGAAPRGFIPETWVEKNEGQEGDSEGFRPETWVENI